jgi:hypothetical protein
LQVPGWLISAILAKINHLRELSGPPPRLEVAAQNPQG